MKDVFVFLALWVSLILTMVFAIHLNQQNNMEQPEVKECPYPRMFNFQKNLEVMNKRSQDIAIQQCVKKRGMCLESITYNGDDKYEIICTPKSKGKRNVPSKIDSNREQGFKRAGKSPSKRVGSSLT